MSAYMWGARILWMRETAEWCVGLCFEPASFLLGVTTYMDNETSRTGEWCTRTSFYVGPFRFTHVRRHPDE